MFKPDAQEMKRVQDFRDAAIKDDWLIEPTYPGYEDMSYASSLSKDGWNMMILTRPNEASIDIWAPDKMSITVPKEYNFEEIKRMVRHCENCGADDVDTQRYSFAGRCCANCRPEMAKKHEYPGWEN